jgi:hypothetical protein
MNFGGDKVWPTPQDEFPRLNGRPWPPDHWFDGAVFESEMGDGTVTLRGPVSDYCGARLVREISLPGKGRVLIRQRMEKVRLARNAGLEPVPMTIWSVTQVRSPEQILFPLNPESKFDSRVYIFPQFPRAKQNVTVDEGIGVLVPSSQSSQKVGADAGDWLVAIVDDVAIAQLFSWEAGAEFPDGGLSLEVFTSWRYTELEILSPIHRMVPGESFSFSVAWDLKRLNEGTVEARRSEAVSWVQDLGR